MKPNSLNLISFSPTGTTRRILEEIKNTLSVADGQVYDLTFINESKTTTLLPADSISLIGLPVYGGRLPLEGVERLQQINGNGSLAVLVVMYGNRHYDDALLELHDLAIEQGFKPIAAAAFIGEHSFTTEEKPLAVGRPDALDLEKARSFATNIDELLERSTPIEPISVVGNSPFKERGQLPPLSPETNAERCDKCGVCVDVCPTQAISINGSVTTDVASCIWCCACIKACPSDARFFENERIAAIREKLFANCQERREPELFI